MVAKTDIKPMAAHELAITRLIAAPREIVFEAWTRHLPEWWGPHGMTTPVCELDLRFGGALHTVMRAPDGTEFPVDGVFLDVVRPEKIVFTDAYRAGWVPAERAFMTSVMTFEEEGGKTRYTARALHWSEADQKEHEQMGFHDGWGQSADRFEAVVARFVEQARATGSTGKRKR